MIHKTLTPPQIQSAERTRWIIGAFLIAALSVAGWHIAHLLASWRVLAAYPYGVDYGEGIVWQQMLNIIAGQGYAPLGTYPAIVYHYPPVYHAVTAIAMLAFGGDPLTTGRIISISATIASAALIALLATEATGKAVDPLTRRLCGVGAGAMFLISGPTLQWGAVMRVDMLACGLSLGGIWLAIVATRRSGMIHGASLLFVLAVYTKQVSIAAPLAGIGGLLLADRRLALICLAETASLGLAALGALEIATDGGFLRHVILYNVNRIDWSALQSLAPPIRDHMIIAVLAAFGACDLARRARRDGSRAVLLAFLGIKLIMLAMIVKSGANTNYLIETMAAVAIVAGGALAPVIDHVRGAQTKLDPVRVGFAVLLLAQATTLPVRAVTDRDADQERRIGDHLVKIIRATKQPVISDDMTFLLRAGKPVEWEPAIVAELGHLGRYDEAGFISMVRAHRFAFFLTEGDRGIAIFDARYRPAVLAAIEEAYPRKRNFEGYILRLPPA